MKINKKEFVTELSEAASLSEVCSEINAYGEPCLLIVFGDADFKADGAFPAELPFITAFAAAEPESVSDEVRSCFDLVISSENTDEYTEKLFKDKTKAQINEINKCFITARTGSQEDVLECESRAFYRLMAMKNGGGCNE